MHRRVLVLPLAGSIGCAAIAGLGVYGSTEVPDAGTEGGRGAGDDSGDVAALPFEGGAHTYRDMILNEGPLAYWRLGEAPGIAAGEEILQVTDFHAIDATLPGPAAR